MWADEDDDWSDDPEDWNFPPPGHMQSYFTSGGLDEATVTIGDDFQFRHLVPHNEDAESEPEPAGGLLFVEDFEDGWFRRRWERLKFLFRR